jgi:exopolyphosphatase/guanosine-5'-triphosphate,3'-diphosphate pyrophosphatase
MNLSKPEVNIYKEKNRIIIEGKHLYLAKEKSKTRELFFELVIKGEK